MHHTLMTVVFDYYSASNSEKRRNKLIQKKNLSKADYQNTVRVGSLSRSELSGSQDMSYIEERKESVDSSFENSENIDIVINKDDSHSISSSSTGNNKQDIYNNAIINFINEKNITYQDDINENEIDHNSKIDDVYRLLFKEYCQNNNIKLTDKEATIDSFLVYEQLTQYYQKVYDTFINQNGISPLNISNTVIDEVKHTLQNNTYSHKIYKHVIFII